MKITGAQVFEARGTFVNRDLYMDGGMLRGRVEVVHMLLGGILNACQQDLAGLTA